MRVIYWVDLNYTKDTNDTHLPMVLPLFPDTSIREIYPSMDRCWQSDVNGWQLSITNTAARYVLLHYQGQLTINGMIILKKDEFISRIGASEMRIQINDLPKYPVEYSTGNSWEARPLIYSKMVYWLQVTPNTFPLPGYVCSRCFWRCVSLFCRIWKLLSTRLSKTYRLPIQFSNRSWIHVESLLQCDSRRLGTWSVS